MSLIGQYGLQKGYHKIDLENVINQLAPEAAKVPIMKETLKDISQKKQKLSQDLESQKNETKKCKDSIPRRMRFAESAGREGEREECKRDINLIMSENEKKNGRSK